MEIPYYQVDSFTNKIFGGNPAGVCLLDSWIDDSLMISIAAENCLPETAFVVKNGENYEIRWFTPQVEVDLCGHATLASAYVILNYVEPSLQVIEFQSKSGVLTIKREGELFVLDLPSRKPQPCDVPEELLIGLGLEPMEVLRSRDYLAVYKNEEEVRELTPYNDALSKLDALGIIVTAPGKKVDFVSRFFAPRVGVPEDPVTGSAHCTLIPYWARRLHKNNLVALQISPRGGELFCENSADRVFIKGRGVTFMQGTMQV